MFDMQKFLDGEIGLRFESEEVYNAFMQTIEQNYPNVTWRSGDKPTVNGKYEYIDNLWCNYYGDEPHTLSRNGHKEDCMEITVTKEDFMNTLTIDMLKTSDILVMEDGYKYHSGMLLKDTEIGHVIRWNVTERNGVCWSNSSVLNAMEHIVKVIRPTNITDFCAFKIEERGKVVWERKNVKELTVAEIEELLGYKVKVVADEKG